MAEKEKIFEQKVKMSGLFDFKEVYQFVYRWLVEEKYDVEEQKYSEEVTGDSKKIEIVWEANKKISDYFKNQMKLAWRIIGMKSVEVEKNGKKVKTNQGTFEVKISGGKYHKRESPFPLAHRFFQVDSGNFADILSKMRSLFA